MITEDSWRRAADALRSVERVSLACHIGPDGDALGSMLAVALGLKSRGVTVACSWGQEPFAVPQPFASFLPGLDTVVRPHELPEAPVFVAFDTGALDRLGSLAERAKNAPLALVVDHHRTNDGFADIDLLDPDAAASVVLARELLRRLDVPLTPEIATCLYVGLVTDTGRFQYRNTTPETHELAAELLAAGVEQDAIARALYETRTLGALRASAATLANLHVVEEASLVWSSLTLAEIEAAGASRDDLDGMIDQIRTLDACDAALMLKQAADGGWRGSLRSKGGTDVGAVAASFGGGGHTLAAGFTVPDEPKTPEKIAKLVVERILAAK